MHLTVNSGFSLFCISIYCKTQNLYLIEQIFEKVKNSNKKMYPLKALSRRRYFQRRFESSNACSIPEIFSEKSVNQTFVATNVCLRLQFSVWANQHLYKRFLLSILAYQVRIIHTYKRINEAEHSQILSD